MVKTSSSNLLHETGTVVVVAQASQRRGPVCDDKDLRSTTPCHDLGLKLCSKNGFRRCVTGKDVGRKDIERVEEPKNSSVHDVYLPTGPAFVIYDETFFLRDIFSAVCL